MAWKVGDACEVLSTSQGRWVEASILHVADEDMVCDGATVRRGSCFVLSEIGEKWVFPDQLKERLRCRSAPGRRQGAFKETSAKRPRLAKALSAKCWLDELLRDSGKLAAHASAIFGEAGGRDSLPFHNGVGIAVEQLLMRPIQKRLRINSKAFATWKAKFDLEGRISLSNFTKLCFSVVRERCDFWFPKPLITTKDFVRENKEYIWQVYERKGLMGEGAFGKVYEVLHKVSRERRVCKVIRKEDEPVEMALKEIHAMSVLDHPHIVRAYEYFEDDEAVYQIMELCGGGELHQHVEDRRTRMSEADIARVLSQALNAVAFCHGHNILHKDLKPQNILFADSQEAVKLIDFGLAEATDETKSASRGTLLYSAPEVLRGRNGVKADIWSLGVVLYNLITGDWPFMEPFPCPSGRWSAQTEKRIRESPMAPHPCLRDGHVGEACLELLTWMLEKDPSKRPSAAECLAHRWLQVSEDPPCLSAAVVRSIEAFVHLSPLKRALWQLAVYHRTHGEDDLRTTFTGMAQKSGTIRVEDLRDALIMGGLKALDAERAAHSLAGRQGIEWTAFETAASCLSSHSYATLFRTLGGHKGFMTLDGLQAFAGGEPRWRAAVLKEWPSLAKCGEHCTEEQFTEYMDFRVASASDVGSEASELNSN